MKIIQHRSSVLVAVLFLLATSLFGADATVKTVRGKVEYLFPGSNQYLPLRAGMKIPIGTIVKTGFNGEAVIVVVPGVAIKVAKETDITIEQPEGDPAKNNALIDLRQGSLSALRDHSATNLPLGDFKVKTPQGVAAARGTFFAVVVDQGETYVGVSQGKVQVDSYRQ